MGRHRTYDCGPQCEVERALEPLIGKWKGSIVFLMRDRSIRFNSLLTLLPGVSTRILTKQLKEMESDGLITRTVISDKPIAVEYSLTPYGQRLTPIIEALINWRNQPNERCANFHLSNNCSRRVCRHEI